MHATAPTRPALTPPPATSPPHSTEGFEDQVAWFLERHSQGFDSPRWKGDMRGEGVRKQLKRHRDPVVAEARQLLNADRLRDRLMVGSFDEIVSSLVRVLRDTSLVPVGQVQKLEGLDAHQRGRLATALVDHLHPRPGPGAPGSMGALVDVLKPLFPTLRSTWSLITAPRALLYPRTHVCVTPGKFALQARALGMELPAAGRPCERDYLQFRRVARHVELLLRARSVPPTDLLDVLDFMRVTLSPRARATLPGASRRRRQRLVRARGVA